MALRSRSVSGELHTTFNVDFGGDDGPSRVGVQPDGTVVVAGATFLSGFVDGLRRGHDSPPRAPDSSFDVDGTTTTSFPAYELAADLSARDVVTQHDGKLVVLVWLLTRLMSPIDCFVTTPTEARTGASGTEVSSRSICPRASGWLCSPTARSWWPAPPP